MRTVLSLLASSLLAGCSDYRFKAKEFGALSVEPTSLEIAAACEYESCATGWSSSFRRGFSSTPAARS